MPKITYIEADETVHVLELENGTTLMAGATSNAIPGIDGECGGACSCATCHVYIDREWLAEAGKKLDQEEAMLDFVELADDYSRLACQITVNDYLDGLVVRIPEYQG